MWNRIIAYIKTRFKTMENGNIIFLIICLSSILISLMNSLQSIYLSLLLSLVNFSCLVSTVILIVLFYRWKKQMNLLLSAIIFTAVTVSWFMSDGFNGGAQYYYIFCFIVPAILLRGIKLFLTLILEILGIVCLFILEYHYPSITGKYPNSIARYMDISFSLILSFTGSSLGTKLIIYFLDREKKISEQKNRDLVTTMDELKESRKNLEAALSVSEERKRALEREMQERRAFEREAQTLALSLAQRKDFGDIAGGKSGVLVYQSASMQTILKNLHSAAGISKPVLILGETGTGKELIARLLHKEMGNPGAPFVAVNCAAIPQTLWESELFGYVKGSFTNARKDHSGAVKRAGKGLLFFDEIGEIPAEIQAKLLRLLQENRYLPVGSEKELNSECRFAFATNRNIPEMIQSGKFREDLYYRISVFSFEIPPLRSRPEDIPALLHHFFDKYGPDFHLAITEVDQSVVDRLSAHPWPGNVRELENLVIRSLALMTGNPARPRPTVYTMADLPSPLSGTPSGLQNGLSSEFPGDIPFDERIRRFTASLLRESLARANGNKTRAAESLGMKRTTFAYQCRELGIEEGE